MTKFDDATPQNEDDKAKPVVAPVEVSTGPVTAAPVTPAKKDAAPKKSASQEAPAKEPADKGVQVGVDEELPSSFDKDDGSHYHEVRGDAKALAAAQAKDAAKAKKAADKAAKDRKDDDDGIQKVRVVN